MRRVLRAGSAQRACKHVTARHHHRSACIARRLQVVQSSTNGFIASAIATSEPVQPSREPNEVKELLRTELKGLDRGIFGVPAAKKARILALIAELEHYNAQKAPTSSLEIVAGEWRLLYSTITITGAKRTKLGLREFVRLGEFTQHIDTANNLAVNQIEFSVSGLSSLRGSLTIRAQYGVVSEQRVGITYLDSALTPSQLQKIFEANLDLLLSIFNPEGHLDITFLEADPAALGSWRVGRDNKGNVFLLERPQR